MISTVSSLVCIPLGISMSFMMAGGLNQCMPMNRSGLPEDRASFRDGYLARIGGKYDGRARKSVEVAKEFFFRLLILDDGFDDQVGLSGHSSISVVVEILDRVSSASRCDNFASLNTASRNLLILDRAFSRYFESVSSSEGDNPAPGTDESNPVSHNACACDQYPFDLFHDASPPA